MCLCVEKTHAWKEVLNNDLHIKTREALDCSTQREMIIGNWGDSNSDGVVMS